MTCVRRASQAITMPWRMSRLTSAISEGHEVDVRLIYSLLLSGERGPDSAGHFARDAPKDAADVFVSEHSISKVRPVAPLDARVAALAAALRHAARRAVFRETSPELRRRGVTPLQLPLPLECEFELPELPVPAVLNTLGPNPLSVTYASSLRPLPPDPQRRVTGLGLGAGALHHRPRKGVQRPAKGRAPVELWRWNIRAKACPSAAFVRKASKCLLTRDWKVAFTEQKFVKAMARIDELKNQGAWSFRQPKRVRGPPERKTHWDYMLDEMRWLQTDYREERKWKIAVAHELAHQAALYHRASPEVRARLCVARGVRRERGSPEAMDVEPEHEDAGARVASTSDADDADDADNEAHEPPGEEPAEADAEDGGADADADADADSTVLHEPEFTHKEPEQEHDGDHGDDAMRAGAPDRDATLSNRLPPALVTAVRAPIFSMDATATSVSPWTLLHSLDPDTASTLLQIDGGSDGEMLKSLDPMQLDFARLFPELPQYAPPTLPEETRGGTDRRRVEGAAQSRLAHVTRLMDTRPVLVSTLEPALNRSRGQWDTALDAPDIPEHMQPASLLFARRAGKPSREPASHPATVPAPPANPEERATRLSWTAADDEFLNSLVRQYNNNWLLIADVFNSARQVLYTDRRTAWDCLDRSRKLNDAQDTKVDVQPEGVRKHAHRQHLADAVKKCAKLREHVHRQAVVSAQSSAAGSAAKTAAANEARAQTKTVATPTPQALGMLKAERDQAALRQFLEQQRAAQLAFQQQQQQRVQMAQSQVQSDAGRVKQRSPAQSPVAANAQAAQPQQGVAQQAPAPAAQTAQQYLNALSSAGAAAQAKQALLVSQSGQVPLVRNQPFMVENAGTGSSTATPGVPLRGSNAQLALQQAQYAAALEKKQAAARPPIVVAQGTGSPVARMSRTPSNVALRSPLGLQNVDAPGTSPVAPSPPPGVAFPGVPALGAAQVPGSVPMVRPGAQSPSIGRPSLAGGGVPPNLHALQQQLAISLAASHLSQEQINGLALQLYKQAQAQQVQAQAQAQAQVQAQAQRPAPRQGQSPVPSPAATPGSAFASLPRYVPVQPGVGVARPGGSPAPSSQSPAQSSPRPT